MTNVTRSDEDGALCAEKDVDARKDALMGNLVSAIIKACIFANFKKRKVL